MSSQAPLLPNTKEGYVLLTSLPNTQSLYDRSSLIDSIADIKSSSDTYEIKYAILSKINENAQFSDYVFKYHKENNYYVRIEYSLNSQFGHKNIAGNNKLFHNKNNIIDCLNFNIQKYIVSLIISQDSKTNGYQIIQTVPLSSETVSIYQATSETLNKIAFIKKISNEKDFNQFKYELEYQYVIEIETRKPLSDTTMKGDNIVSVVYLIIDNRNYYKDLFSKMINMMLFSRSVLENYIIKYIYELVYKFCSLPCNEIIDLIGSFGIYNGNASEKSSNIFQPMKSQAKTLNEINIKNKIKNLYMNMTNISSVKNKLSSAPFHKILLCDVKYDKFYNEKEFKINKKHQDSKQYEFLASSLLEDKGKNKERKIDSIALSKQIFQELNSILSMDLILNDNNSEYFTQHLKSFFLSFISNKLSMDTSYQGFFHIDIIINDDQMFKCNPLSCACVSKSVKKSCSHFTYKILNSLLNKLNFVFSANDGFYHKHLAVNNLSYNFNEKNIIYIFPHYTDASLKNKIRIFDIPFHQKWLKMIASLIIQIYIESFDFLNFGKEKQQQKNFISNFIEITEQIIKEFFIYYEKGLPDYQAFCDIIAETPLKGYNKIDNVCQHFANVSSEELIKRTCKYYPIFNVMFLTEKCTYKYPKPRFDCILEPYLVLCDKKIQLYLETNNKKKFLMNNEGSYREFMQKVKELTPFMKARNIINLTIKDKFFLKESYNSIDSKHQLSLRGSLMCKSGGIILLDQEEDMEKMMFNSNFCNNYNSKNIYDYLYLLNLSYSLRYKYMKKIKKRIIYYSVLKKYSISHNEDFFNDFDNTVLIGIDDNSEREKTEIKKNKKELINLFNVIRKIKKKIKKITKLFYDYVAFISREMSKKEDDKTDYIRIGYYVINFKNFFDEQAEKEFIKTFIKN